jgi:hypothetical protein
MQTPRFARLGYWAALIAAGGAVAYGLTSIAVGTLAPATTPAADPAGAAGWADAWALSVGLAWVITFAFVAGSLARWFGRHSRATRPDRLATPGGRRPFMAADLSLVRVSRHTSSGPNGLPCGPQAARGRRTPGARLQSGRPPAGGFLAAREDQRGDPARQPDAELRGAPPSGDLPHPHPAR